MLYCTTLPCALPRNLQEARRRALPYYPTLLSHATIPRAAGGGVILLPYGTIWYDPVLYRATHRPGDGRSCAVTNARSQYGRPTSAGRRPLRLAGLLTNSYRYDKLFCYC